MWISVSKFVIFWTHCRLLGFSTEKKLEYSLLLAVLPRNRLDQIILSQSINIVIHSRHFFSMQWFQLFPTAWCVIYSLLRTILYCKIERTLSRNIIAQPYFGVKFSNEINFKTLFCFRLLMFTKFKIYFKAKILLSLKDVNESFPVSSIFLCPWLIPLNSSIYKKA